MPDDDRAALHDGLRMTAVALSRADIPYALCGGYAAWARGAPEPSHDADFVPQLGQLLDAQRRVGVLGLREYISVELAGLQERGLQLYDLEDHVGAFISPLPRVRIIPLDEFDPRRYL